MKGEAIKHEYPAFFNQRFFLVYWCIIDYLLFLFDTGF